MAKDGDKDPFELRLDYQNPRDMTAAPRLSAEIKALYVKMSSDNAAAMGYVFLSLLSFVLVPFGISFAISGALVLVLALVVMSHVSSTRKLKVIYSFDSDSRRVVDKRMLPFVQISRCSRVWQITSSISVHDPKYNAGASANVTRRLVNVHCGSPSQFHSNEKGVTIELAGIKYVFMPDRVFVFGAELSFLTYDQVQWSVRPYAFIESNGAPRDARVIGHTWQYVNKDGGPDKRFNYNPRYDECQYGRLNLSLSGGRSFDLMLSSTTVSEALAQLAH